jgi:hypothetical protein
MAKVKSAGELRKISFGRRKGGKPAKSKGPKVKATSKYRGQGR